MYLYFTVIKFYKVVKLGYHDHFSRLVWLIIITIPGSILVIIMMSLATRKESVKITVVIQVLFFSEAVEA